MPLRSAGRRSALVVALLIAVVSNLRAPAASAQGVDTNLWGTDGQVKSVVRSGNKVYIGGSFTQVGPCTGGGVPLDVSTGGFPGSFPHVGGAVNAVASDGSGGWYIGGQFTNVGGLTRNNLAHIASDMSVTSWDPNADNVVRALVVNGSKVIVGGDFMNVGGQARNFLAALDATTGAATSWNPDCGNIVNALALNGSTVYVGGGFANIGPAMRNNAAEVDLATGLATSWNPNVGSSVSAIAVGPSVVYLGGAFSLVGGQPRNAIAAVDSGTGGLRSWNPNSNNTVNAIAVVGSTVYAGGSFSTIGSQSRNRTAALSASSGLATAWNPGLVGNLVSGLLATPTTVYVGGIFSKVGGSTRYNLAALDVTTGAPTAWDPRCDISVLALALNGSTVYAGGNFGLMNAQARLNLAQLDANTGAATSWDPSPNGTVDAIAVSGDSIYVAGAFTSIAGLTRNHIARIDGSGAATGWNPNANSEAMCLTLGPGVVYAGGTFSNIGGLGRSRIAALSTANGAPTSWNPSGSGTVSAIALGGSTVYVGGSFNSLGGMGRTNLGACSSSGTGAVTAWNPNADGAVSAIAVNGSTVYVGGGFLNIGGAARQFLAAIDASTGVATSWNPSPNGGVSALAVDVTRLYAAGSFNIALGSGFGLAAYDIASGSLTAWNPDGNNAGSCLSVSGNRIYAGGYFTTLHGQPHARLASIQAAPEISAVNPLSGGNTGVVTLSVSGRNLVPGATVSLQRMAPLTTLGPVTATVATDGASLTASIDLTGAATGGWNVVVTNPDLQAATLQGAFTITSLQAPQIQLALLGPEPIRASYPTAFDLVIENLGNVDATNVPVWISGIPTSGTLGLDFTLSPPPQSGGEPDWSQVPGTLGTANGQVMSFVIPRVPPGTTTRRFTVNVPASVTQFQLGAAVTPAWSADATFLQCLSSVGVIQNPSCDGAQLTSINSYLTANPQIEAMSGMGIWSKAAWQCEGATTLGQAEGKAGLVVGYLDNAVETGSTTAGCGDSQLPIWRPVRTVHTVTSIDPNDKLAPQGTISTTQAVPYSLRFENLSTATAPARVVTLVDQLATSLDLNSLSLDAIDLFGTVHLIPAPGSKQFLHDVDLGHDNLIVRVSVSLDTPSRQLVWSFATLDKTTQQPPSNPLLGFLPPNQTPPQGEGSVLFEIRPVSSTPNGALIQNTALLTFDGASQNTPTVSNTLDNTAPSSNVLALGNPIPSQTFPVSWTATGSPTDLKDFTVYVAEDGNAYQAWKVNTITTSDTYVPRPGGHTYAFYSVARDVSGNIEAAPPSPDTQTQSTTAVETEIPRQLALAGARPNPARGILNVAFALPSSERATLELIDIAGRRVARREVGEMGPGSHELSFDALRLKAGLYFLRLTQAGQVLRTRVVLAR